MTICCQILQLLLLLEPFYGTTRVSRYQKKHSSTHLILIIIQSLSASSIYYDPQHPPFNLRAWQSFCTTSLQVLFGLPLGLEPSTLYSIHFFTQSASSFCNTCPYHCSLFCCSTKIVSSIPNLYWLQMNDFVTLYMLLFIPIHFLCTRNENSTQLFWQLNYTVFRKKHPLVFSVITTSQIYQSAQKF